MNPYRQDDPKFPYLHTFEWYGYGTVRFVMSNERSVNWYAGDIVTSNKEYLDLIKPDDVVVDCGANEGFLAVLAAIKTGRGGQVIAVEPAMHNWGPIEINMALNKVRSQCVLHQVAVGDKDGEIKFSGEAADAAAAQNVAVQRIDRFLMLVPDVIKMDVEGYELKALRGAKSTLDNYKPDIFLEPHLGRDTGGVDMRNFGDTPEQLFEFMSDLGYVFYQDGRLMRGPIPHGAVVLRHPHRKPLRTLVYTVAIGDWYRKMAHLWRQSLQASGYRGEIIIFSDDPDSTMRPLPLNSLPNVPGKEIWCRHIVGLYLNSHDYDVVMHMDSDCIVAKSLKPMFRCVMGSDNRWAFEEMELHDGNRKYFLPPDLNLINANMVRGVGGAIFAAKGKIFAAYCKQVLDEVFRIEAWKMPCMDQNAINGMVARGELAHQPWPDAWACFSNIGSEPITEDTRVIHFTGEPEKKFCYMQSVSNLLKLCK